MGEAIFEMKLEGRDEEQNQLVKMFVTLFPDGILMLANVPFGQTVINGFEWTESAPKECFYRFSLLEQDSIIELCSDEDIDQEMFCQGVFPTICKALIHTPEGEKIESIKVLEWRQLTVVKSKEARLLNEWLLQKEESLILSLMAFANQEPFNQLRVVLTKKPEKNKIEMTVESDRPFVKRDEDDDHKVKLVSHHIVSLPLHPTWDLLFKAEKLEPEYLKEAGIQCLNKLFNNLLIIMNNYGILSLSDFSGFKVIKSINNKKVLPVYEEAVLSMEEDSFMEPFKIKLVVEVEGGKFWFREIHERNQSGEIVLRYQQRDEEMAFDDFEEVCFYHQKMVKALKRNEY